MCLFIRQMLSKVQFSFPVPKWENSSVTDWLVHHGVWRNLETFFPSEQLVALIDHLIHAISKNEYEDWTKERPYHARKRKMCTKVR